jgi:subtilisin family serine protease
VKGLYTYSLGLLFLLQGIGNSGYSQDNSEEGDKKTVEEQNWHHLDPKTNKLAGISTDKAYKELLVGKPMVNVVVAVLDGGVDINHEDLIHKIWVNQREIAGNGIDDDNNGYIDDIHGWNFIGNAEGKNLDKVTLEITRVYKTLSEKFKHANPVALKGAELDEYNGYLKIKAAFNAKYEKAKKSYANFQSFAGSYLFCDSIISAILKRTDYTLSDIKSIDAGGNAQIDQIKKYMIKLNKNGLNRVEFNQYKEYLETQVNYQLNLDFSPRAVILGDNPEVFGSQYGNNDVIGPNPKHGTAVAGVIAACRNNNLGMNGIADSVKIMVLRVVPDGDEYDKDIANAIIYAANNGAQIINCSFGKAYSPQKQFVDEALKFARDKGVLIVHAAGNDAEDNDSIIHYPSNLDAFGNVIMENWITVGASASKKDKTLPALFSNYGKKTVDIFAPGRRIYTTKPQNTYSAIDGTSFSAPMVSGTAALIKSVYPKLTSAQIKEIILKSAITYPKLKVIKPNEQPSKTQVKVKFSELSTTAGVLNIYTALKLAGNYAK